MKPTVVLLLGKPPKPGTIVDDLRTQLVEAGCAVEVVLPKQGESASGTADLVVHRGLGARASEWLRPFLDAGVTVCPGTADSGSRSALWADLVAGGVRVPGARRRAAWGEVLAEEPRKVVVKSEQGSGRGQEVAVSPLPPEPVFEGPYLVEEYVENDGWDRKLYVAGDGVFGLLKPSPLRSAAGLDGAAVLEVTQDLRTVALAAAAATGLHLCGVDVILGEDGPVVVDVNPFPGYRGVPGAGEAVVRHVLGHLPGL